MIDYARLRTDLGSAGDAFKATPDDSLLDAIYPSYAAKMDRAAFQAKVESRYGMVAPVPHTTPVAMGPSFGQKVAADARGIGQGIATLGSAMQGGAIGDVAARQLVEGLPESVRQVGRNIRHPIAYAKEHPLNAALDVAGIATGAGAGFRAGLAARGAGAGAARAAVEGAAEAVGLPTRRGVSPYQPPAPPGTEAFGEMVAGPRAEMPRNLAEMQRGLASGGLERIGKPNPEAILREPLAPETTPNVEFMSSPNSPVNVPDEARGLAADAMARGTGVAKAEEFGPLVEQMKASNIRDRGVPRFARETPDRNIEATFQDPAVADAVKQVVSEPVKVAVTDMTQFTDQMRRALDAGFKRLGIRRGSREDYLAGDFAEGKITLPELQRASPKNWDNIRQAAEGARQVYDHLIERVNQSIVPHGYDAVTPIDNYVTHTKRASQTGGPFAFLKEPDVRGGEIQSIGMRPGKRSFRFGLHRQGGSTHEGLIKAMDTYLDPAAHQIFLTKPIQDVRAFQQAVEASGDARLGGFQNYLANHANYLAGKPHTLDAAVEATTIGKRLVSAMDKARRRVSSNMIGGSTTAPLTNFAPFRMTIATTRPDALMKALPQALLAPMKADRAIIDGMRSAFLTRRFGKGMIGRTAGSTARDVAGIGFKAADEFTASLNVAGKYYEGIGQGLSKSAAMRAADEYAARVIGDRSIGQIPPMFQSKLLGPLAQFQLEVNNEASFVLKDVPRNFGYSKARAAATIGGIAINSYLFNEAFERIAGRRPTLDPIHIAQSALDYAENSDEPIEMLDFTKFWTPAGELVGNLPFSGVMTGGRFPLGSALPNPKSLVQGPHGEGPSLKNTGKEMLKPVAYLLPPFGGGQAKRSAEGALAYKKQEFDMEQTPANLIRSLLYGKYSTPAAKQYFEERR